MSDNLAHKLDALALGTPPPSKPADNNFSNSNSQELSLDRLKYQANKPQPGAKLTATASIGKGIGGSTAQQLDRAKNAAAKALSGKLTEAAEEGIGAGTQIGTQWLLTTLWGSVWLDWTLLSLLGLNTLLACSILLPNYVCQFGDDYLIGKWIPNRDLAKWTEIIILMIINMVVLSIIIIFVVIIYKIVTCGTWDLFNVWLSGVLPGGDTVLSEAQKRCFQ